MKHKLLLVAAIAALVVVGGGCGRKAAPPVAPVAPAAVEPSDSVDATVDEILKETSAEAAELDKEASDAAELNATDAEIKAFGDSSYDVQ